MAEIHDNEPDNEIRGHSDKMEQAIYARNPTDPQGVNYNKLQSYRLTACQARGAERREAEECFNLE